MKRRGALAQFKSLCTQTKLNQNAKIIIHSIQMLYESISFIMMEKLPFILSISFINSYLFRNCTHSDFIEYNPPFIEELQRQFIFWRDKVETET